MLKVPVRCRPHTMTRMGTVRTGRPTCCLDMVTVLGWLAWLRVGG